MATATEAQKKRTGSSKRRVVGEGTQKNVDLNGTTRNTNGIPRNWTQQGGRALVT